MGIRETRVGAVVAECVGGMGRAELRAPQSLGQVESQKRPCERVESGLWRARSQRRQPPRRRGPKGRAPARELQAGGAPSDPQGAGCRDIGPQRTRSGASGSPSGRNPGLGSLTLPGAPCLSGVERPETRGMKAIGFRAEAARRPPHPPLFSQKCWVTSSGIARRADTVQDGMSLNQDCRRQAWVCPNASTSSVRGLGGAKTPSNPERSKALLFLEVSALGARAALGEDRPPFALPLAENRTLNCFACGPEREEVGGRMLLPSEIPSLPRPSIAH